MLCTCIDWFQFYNAANCWLLKKNFIMWNLSINFMCNHINVCWNCCLFPMCAHMIVQSFSGFFWSWLYTIYSKAFVHIDIEYYHPYFDSWIIFIQTIKFISCLTIIRIWITDAWLLFWVMQGSLSAAKDFTRDVPFEVDASIWVAFLGVCKFHRNIKLAEHAAKNLLTTETQSAAV